ncbi:hypothetical protein GWN42_19440 [candidate division KSB1 bacterium]|nr:hypothetical protein [candidate division KSB1 bacterium]
MKQLTIFCSEELTGEVSQVLHKYEVEGFIHMPGLYGNKLKPKGSFEKDLTWQASAFVIFPDETKLSSIIQELSDYANKCEVRPCLRMVVVPVEQMY